jgi:hypothetical protein
MLTYADSRTNLGMALTRIEKVWLQPDRLERNEWMCKPVTQGGGGAALHAEEDDEEKGMYGWGWWYTSGGGGYLSGSSRFEGSLAMHYLDVC